VEGDEYVFRMHGPPQGYALLSHPDLESNNEKTLDTVSWRYPHHLSCCFSSFLYDTLLSTERKELTAEMQ